MGGAGCRPYLSYKTYNLQRIKKRGYLPNGKYPRKLVNKPIILRLAALLLSVVLCSGGNLLL